MWQKQLKRLRKEAPESNKVTGKNSPESMEMADIKFSDYCENQGVQPIKQDTVILKTPPEQNKIHVPKLNEKIQDFAFINEDHAATEFFRFGQRNLPKEMRQGKYKISSTLDLHGYTKAHAIMLLENFLKVNQGGSCLKIIHGQGMNSKFNQPVLKNTVRNYLERLTNIIAYTHGAPNQGGDGVTLVKLQS